jgi:chaperone required for assembly of F1-ATPase
MKRFWDRAEVVALDGRYAIRLDGRPMRLPGRAVLALESRALADAIAEEWQAAGGGKGGILQAEELPLTRLAGTAQERVVPNPGLTIEALLKYGATDLLCYEAEGPEGLVALQAERWEPWLAWVARVHGARLIRVRGVMPVDQPDEAIAALRMALTSLPAAALAGLGVLVPATGSLVLGLAVAGGALGADEAHALAALDELYQAEKWGEDREAVTRRRHVAEDIAVAARFMALSGLPG